MASPQAVFECRPSSREARYEKKHAALAVVTDDHWRALVALLGDPDWACDPHYANEAGRRAAEELIEAALAAWFAEQDCDEVVDRLLAVGVPAGTLVNGYMLSPNEQLEARGFRRTLEHAVSKTKHYPGLPFQLSSEAAAVYAWAAPTIGEHNEEVLGELGLSETEIEVLREAGVIGTRPAFEV